MAACDTHVQGVTLGWPKKESVGIDGTIGVSEWSKVTGGSLHGFSSVCIKQVDLEKKEDQKKDAEILIMVGLPMIFFLFCIF